MKVISRHNIVTASHVGHTKTFEVHVSPWVLASPVSVIVFEVKTGISGTGETEEAAILDAFKRMGIQ